MGSVSVWQLPVFPSSGKRPKTPILEEALHNRDQQSAKCLALYTTRLEVKRKRVVMHADVDGMLFFRFSA
ncbi:hypothetical protein EV669_1055 [Gulbenkiania mobilis]|uniref:Uncharacterized protein n=1 Tax=Gulbenkiania mobilis TaxID=397457 RepID=A0ABY2CYT5_GULMO|nr:hypothetical protein EV669_1055 [Gulbenkiania mobilis]